MTIINLILGPVKFANYEIPSSINFGGAQALAVKQLVGGQRIVDAMGRLDDDIHFSGLFFGENAAFRAKFLDSLRVLGTPLPLTWSTFNYQVVIKDFKANFERYYQIPYSITLQVIQDLNKPFPLLLPVAFNDAILLAMTEANDLAALINSNDINTQLTLLQSAINAVPDFNVATSAQIASVMGPLNAAIGATNTTISTLMNASSFL